MSRAAESRSRGITLEQADAFSAVARQLGIPDSSLDTFRPAVVDPIHPESYDMLGVYTPGTTYESFENGSGKLLRAGKNHYINFNIHYTTIGRIAVDRSQLALWFQAKPAAHQLIRSPAAVETIIANGRQLLSDDPGTKAEGTDVAIPPIPPYAENYELTGIAAYTRPITIYQLQPHAHMRAKDFVYSVVYPDGTEQTLLSVPKYDFHWQLSYDLQSPVHIPAGGKLIVTAHYDNSTKNPHLRNLGDGDLARNCGPDKQAYFRRQNQSWHEMFSPLVQYSLDASAPGAAAHQRTLKLVQTVGCLAHEPSMEWTLTAASTPRATRTQSTSAAALAANRDIQSGTHRYGLLGIRVFDPQRYDNRKVSVKGVLIDGDGRLNVTSLQEIPGTCP